MCLYPRIIPNRKYTATKKNGGNIPAVYDTRALGVPAICGNCIECRKQKAREWGVRLMEDIKHHKNGKFITLTFSTKSLIEICTTGHITKTDKRTKEIHKIPISQLKGYDRDNAIATWAVRHFLERWRKDYKRSLRHWLVTELGHQNTEHVHLHGILWPPPITEIRDREYDITMEEIERIWNYGWVWKYKIENGKRVNYVNDKTIQYSIKYFHKVDFVHQRYKAIVLCSAGIGAKYVESFNARQNKFDFEQTKQTYTTRTGHQISMPTYWRKKIYNDDEREAMWMALLDKEERYICGEKIDVTKGMEDYFKILEFHRRRAIKLGYGDGNAKKQWNRHVYERERRELIWKIRTNQHQQHNQH